jgi:hypothetical protein
MYHMIYWVHVRRQSGHHQWPLWIWQLLLRDSSPLVACEQHVAQQLPEIPSFWRTTRTWIWLLGGNTKMASSLWFLKALSIHVKVSLAGCTSPCSCTYRNSKQSFRGFDCLTRLTAQFSQDQYKADGFTFTLMPEHWRLFFFFFSFFTIQSSHLIKSKSQLKSQLRPGYASPMPERFCEREKRTRNSRHDTSEVFCSHIWAQVQTCDDCTSAKEKTGLLDQKLLSYMCARNRCFHYPSIYLIKCCGD